MEKPADKRAWTNDCSAGHPCHPSRSFWPILILRELSLSPTLDANTLCTLPILHLWLWRMASTTRAIMRAQMPLSIGFRSTIAVRRSFATSSAGIFTKARASPRASFNKNSLQQSFRRSYADVAPVKKRRKFRWFRWLWRLTYLSTITGAGYLAYGVYELRHPDDQLEPDPSKKNLVILGKWLN